MKRVPSWPLREGVSLSEAVKGRRPKTRWKSVPAGCHRSQATQMDDSAFGCWLFCRERPHLSAERRNTRVTWGDMGQQGVGRVHSGVGQIIRTSASQPGPPHKPEKGKGRCLWRQQIPVPSRNHWALGNTPLPPPRPTAPRAHLLAAGGLSKLHTQARHCELHHRRFVCDRHKPVLALQPHLPRRDTAGPPRR